MPLLKQTSAIIAELFEAISHAEKEILLQAFYVDNDVTTQKLIDLLVEKALQGVKVYCLVDALGGMNFGSQDVKGMLKSSGVHIEYFNWLTPWKGRSKKLWYFRNHKRALIIDNAVVHLGGWCIGDAPLDWVECHIAITDYDVIQDATADFWNMYKYAHKTQFQFSHQKKYVYSSKPFTYTYQAPLIRSRYIYYTQKKLVQSSSHNITLITPYFAPIHGLLHQIRKASNRGVKVQVIVPRNCDHKFVGLVTNTYIANLLRHGIEIYFYDTMIHAKVCVFDTTAYIGTMNLDAVSLRYNFENGLFINETSVVEELNSDIAILQSSCTQITHEEWSKRSIFAKFLDIIMKIFRPLV